MDVVKSKNLILIAENNHAHEQLIKQVLLENSQIQPDIISFSDGQEVLEFLNDRGSTPDSLLPNLMLLDLGIPGKSGIEVLSEIKLHPRLKRIPVVVMDFSSSEDNILRSYTLQGNCYVVKSDDVDELLNTVKRIEEFWLGIATLPSA